MERLGLRFTRCPVYSTEQQQTAWMDFGHSAHGRIILDILFNQVFLRYKQDLRALGAQDLLVLMINSIREAEEAYGREHGQPYIGTLGWPYYPDGDATAR